MNEKGQNEPYILLCGDVTKPDQFMLVIDGHVICDIAGNDILFAVLSAYFIFNICYIPGCINVFKFLETSLLNISLKLPASVNHFMASLSSINMC